MRFKTDADRAAETERLRTAADQHEQYANEADNRGHYIKGDHHLARAAAARNALNDLHQQG
jgi:hypothetical protein